MSTKSGASSARAPGTHAEPALRLSDGTTLDELIDTRMREVSMRALSDPELYDLEQKHLFARAWSVVGHVDEIPNGGDFVLRYLGEDQVIVSRGADDAIHVVLNMCTHRGARLCRSDAGNTNRFECPYHSWAFRPDGTFVGSPFPREQMHGCLRDKSELGLRRARVGVYVGMIFATFDASAPSLDDYLGPFKWYCDLIFARRESGMTVLGPPQRFVIPANWKCGAEQAGGDIFHGHSLHRSMFELTQAPMETVKSAISGVTFSWQGHFMHCFDYSDVYGCFGDELTTAERLRALPPPGMSPDMIDDLARRLGPDELRVLTSFRPTVGNTFPNVQMLAFPQPLPDGRMSAFITWRVYIPRGPDRFELMSWVLVERDSSAELRECIRLGSLMVFGVSGLAESDDTDMWPTQYKNARGGVGRTQKLRYQAIADEDVERRDWPGPGPVYRGITKDNSQWNWWLRYRDFMNGRPWS